MRVRFVFLLNIKSAIKIDRKELNPIFLDSAKVFFVSQYLKYIYKISCLYI